MTKLEIDLGQVDWQMLRKQKLTLHETIGQVRQTCPEINVEDLRGLLHLLDHIQDRAAKILGEEVVFGKEFKSDEADPDPCSKIKMN